MKISRMSNSITPSLTRKLFNMALEIGDDVINLTLGDPDVLPPEEIRLAACRAIMDGKTRYSENAGLKLLRSTYANYFEKEYGFSIDPNKNIITTVGGMEALYLALSTIVDVDDEIIIIAPYYVNYLQMINMCGGKAVVINRLNKTEDELLQDVSDNISSKTVAIIINSPCNPVGDILAPRILDGIAEIAVEKDIVVISDEVYTSLVYDGKKAESISTREGMKERTIIIDSCSKRFAMTGWRVGFAIATQEIISNMVKMQENVAACAPLPSQYAAIKAYSGEVDYSYIKDIYEERRNVVYNAINKVDKLFVFYPEATFYCFVDISRTGLNSEEFAYKLLDQQHVAVVPGLAYGEEYGDYIRIAFTLDIPVLKEAMKRIARFCESLTS